MYDLLLIVFLLVSICLIVLILIQQGKGATMGASFGSGASGTLFGSTGAGNFMTRSTGVLAALFFIISLALGNFASRTTNSSGDEWSNLGKQTVVTQPAVKNTADSVKVETPSNSSQNAGNVSSQKLQSDANAQSKTVTAKTKNSQPVAASTKEDKSSK